MFPIVFSNFVDLYLQTNRNTIGLANSNEKFGENDLFPTKANVFFTNIFTLSRLSAIGNP